MSIPKDPEKFKDWLSHQTLKCQRKWSNPDKVKKHFESAYGRPGIKGADHPNWKGDNICYVSVHLYVKKLKPMPENCERCGSVVTTKPFKDNSGRVRRSLELCNINGNYNRDPNNYKWLCTKCHRFVDGFVYKRARGRYNELFFNQFYAASVALLDSA